MPKGPIQFILDFDGTLTEKDTLQLVAEAGYNRQKVNRPASQITPWQKIVDAYLNDYNAHASTYQPSASGRKTILAEAAWLDSLLDVERASAERVNDAGVFFDLRKQDIEKTAYDALKDGKVSLRPGWAELFSSIMHVNAQKPSRVPGHDNVQIVSVNWSRWFVWSVMWQAALSHDDRDLAEGVQDILLEVGVYANEVPSLTTEDKAASTSVLTPRGKPMALRTAGDKLKHMQTQVPLSSDVTRVYIGDSMTDLECLLMANVGICIRDEDMSSSQQDLDATCKRLGIQVESLRDFKEERSSVSTFEELDKLHSQHPLVIYYAHDFHDVAKWVVQFAL